ncbi:unnamed protein product [Cercospora beticola]|nr:unnamed protein product [Cercospora beticola]
MCSFELRTAMYAECRGNSELAEPATTQKTRIMEVKISEARRPNGQGCELHKEQTISTLYWYSDTEKVHLHSILPCRISQYAMKVRHSPSPTITRVHAFTGYPG